MANPWSPTPPTAAMRDGGRRPPSRWAPARADVAVRGRSSTCPTRSPSAATAAGGRTDAGGLSAPQPMRYSEAVARLETLPEVLPAPPEALVPIRLDGAPW